MERTKAQHQSDNEQPEYLRIDEARKILRMGRTTCVEFLKSKNIQRYQLSEQIILYKRSDILSAIESSKM